MFQNCAKDIFKIFLWKKLVVYFIVKTFYINCSTFFSYTQNGDVYKTKKNLPNSFLLFVQQEMDNLYPCYMALLYFFQPYVHLFKIADKDFCLFMKKNQKAELQFMKSAFPWFFFNYYFLFSLWCCFYSTCTFWLTMAYLNFLYNKTYEKQTQSGLILLRDIPNIIIIHVKVHVPIIIPTAVSPQQTQKHWVNPYQQMSRWQRWA